MHPLMLHMQNLGFPWCFYENFVWRVKISNSQNVKIQDFIVVLKYFFNPIQDGHSRGCSWMRGGRGGKKTPSLKTVTHILQWWNLAVIPCLKKYKKHNNQLRNPKNSANISIFYWKSENVVMSRKTDIHGILIDNF